MSTVSLDKTQVIFDTLRTGRSWTINSAAKPDPLSGLSGFDFEYTTPSGEGALLAQGNRTYALELEVIDQGEEPPTDYQRWEVPTINLLRR